MPTFKVDLEIDNQPQLLSLVFTGITERESKEVKKLIDTNRHKFETLTDAARLVKSSGLIPIRKIAHHLQDKV